MSNIHYSRVMLAHQLRCLVSSNYYNDSFEFSFEMIPVYSDRLNLSRFLPALEIGSISLLRKQAIEIAFNNRTTLEVNPFTVIDYLLDRISESELVATYVKLVYY